ncbi:uncharacterized protein [Drosophila bipectinata]|uniref:uncharacterized protein n=1 Tax=Drosophila bipectinata TaxID=42026 RepID=UPI0038B2D205
MSYISKLVGSKDSIKGLNSCCYFFDLKTGCKLIALFDVLIAFLQIYRITVFETVEMTTSSESPSLGDGLQATREPEVDMFGAPLTTKLQVDKMDSYWLRVLCCVTLLKSILLLAGAQWDHILCLVAWMLITAFSGSLNFFYHLFGEIDFFVVLTQSLTAGIQMYCGLVVYSLTKKIWNKRNDFASEVEVLYSHGSEASIFSISSP